MIRVKIYGAVKSMSICKRRYKLYADFHRVFKFLQDTYDMESLNSYLLPQFFEYAHTHPAFNHKLTHRFGLWEDDGELFGIACYEMDLGETLISVHPDYEFCLPDMLCWAERELSTFNDGVRKHAVWITDKEKLNVTCLSNTRIIVFTLNRSRSSLTTKSFLRLNYRMGSL